MVVALIAATLLLAHPAAAQAPILPPANLTIAPKVVIVAYFEVGNDTGDRPGELQYWVERDGLTRTIEVPGMTHVVHANADGSEIAVLVGPGQIRPAINIMALGADPRFDLRESYWLINGIAGISPHDASLGSVFWTDYVVNGEWLHHIDEREMPSDWPDGYFALGKSRPDEQPRVPPGSSEDVRTWGVTAARSNAAGTVILLNPRLMRWAYDETKMIRLPQTAAMRDVGRASHADPAAAQPPRVGTGANLATEAFWHGARLDAWAHRWIRYVTDGRGRFATTGQNDSGTLVALDALTRAGRADWNRALVLRAASNFDMQRDGISAAQSLSEQLNGNFPAYLPALDAAYVVGHRVVTALMAGAYDR
jgi:purine nucleoside permease